MRKVALWSLPLALAVLWVCGGCTSGDGAARSLATVDTLSNGAVHILNPATGMWSADEAWSVEEIVRIGDAAEGATENSFGDIRAVTFDPLGRIWVVEGQANEIRIFDEEGRHVRTIGGDGDGPGEFSYPMGITWDGEGRAWIADGGNARYTVLDTAGTVLTTYPRTVSGWTLPWRGRFDESGTFWDVAVSRDPEAAEHEVGVLIRVVRMSLGEGVFPVDSVAVPRHEEEVWRVDFASDWYMVPVPFTAKTDWVLGEAAEIWWGTGHTYRIYRLSESGDTTRILELLRHPQSVTADERAEVVARLRENNDTETLKQIDLSRIPDVKPAYLWFIRDDQGFLWVRSTAAVPDATPSFDVFDPGGYYLGSVPADIEGWRKRPVIRGDRMLGVVKDEMNVQYVVLYRIVGRGG